MYRNEKSDEQLIAATNVGLKGNFDLVSNSNKGKKFINSEENKNKINYNCENFQQHVINTTEERHMEYDTLSTKSKDSLALLHAKQANEKKPDTTCVQSNSTTKDTLEAGALLNTAEPPNMPVTDNFNDPRIQTAATSTAPATSAIETEFELGTANLPFGRVSLTKTNEAIDKSIDSYEIIDERVASKISATTPIDMNNISNAFMNEDIQSSSNDIKSMPLKSPPPPLPSTPMPTTSTTMPSCSGSASAKATLTPESLNLVRNATESPSLPKINIHFQLYTKSSTTKTSDSKDGRILKPTITNTTPIVTETGTSSASLSTPLQSSMSTASASCPSLSSALLQSGSNSKKKIENSSSVASIGRKVSFPKSDHELVTGYCEPANPWEHACMVKSISEIINLYVISCQKHNTKPLQNILDHLKSVELNTQTRQPLLSLKSISLSHGDCEALEEIFKRVQYKSIDVSSCDLNECAVSALFEMIEYYEAANELDISSNPKGMTNRGWSSCSYMISHSQELLALNARGNPISKTCAENLGLALTTGNLHTIKLEHCGLKGQPLSGLCFKLRKNRVLKELWLAHNDLDWHDAKMLGHLLMSNHYLELLDISHNNICDDGLREIIKALICQSRQMEQRSMLTRAKAIDDDDPFSSSIDNSDNVDIQSTQQSSDFNVNTTLNSSSIADDKSLGKDVDENASINSANVNAKKAVTVTEENEIDDNTEDTTVRSTTSTIKNGVAQATGGKSMLDKLLSMNSDSSSEEGVSQLSTDTLAACCSEEASLISDDIFNADPFIASNNQSTNTNIKNNNINNTSNVSNKSDDGNCLNRSAKNVISSSKNDTRGNDEKSLELSNNDDKFGDITNSEAMESKTSSRHNLDNGNSSNNSNTSYGLSLQTEPSLINDAAPIYEVTAAESDCVYSSVATNTSDSRRDHVEILMQHSTTRAVDMNVKSTKLCEDYEDTHSTDSAFESASEGDISRNLPEEFNSNSNSRLSLSLETTHLDALVAKDMPIESATIASESTESLVKAIAREEEEAASSLTPSVTPTAHTPPTPPVLAPTIISLLATVTTKSNPPRDFIEQNKISKCLPSQPPKVTILEDHTLLQKHKETSISPSPTPPPPSTSPGGASLGMRRTDSTCGFITQSTRNRSQSSDSLCSDNSLEGSISSESNYSVSMQLNEKLTKNDTLTRQQRQNADTTLEPSVKSPNGLKALAVWSNNLTKDAGLIISDLLAETTSLELLNIGKNCLSNEFLVKVKDNLMKNTTVTTLGLQSAHLSAKGIDTLSSILTFGGNSTLQRIDIRDNKLEVESLNTLADALKSNTTVTQIDIDDEPKRLSVGSDAHMDYTRVLENVRSMCSRNEKTQAQLLADKAANVSGLKRSGGYYVGSRKISLTCYSRPIIDTSTTSASSITTGTTTTTSTVANKLDVKRKTGARLRSPVPSPPSISPSSSPNRSRFQVFRVNEVSPLPSPLAQTPPTPPAAQTSTITMSTYTTTAPVSVSTPSISVSLPSSTEPTTVLPLSSSFPSMANAISSTQSIKRSGSPRSRFHVSKIYDDYPKLPSFRTPSEPTRSISPSPTTSPLPAPVSTIAKMGTITSTTPDNVPESISVAAISGSTQIKCSPQIIEYKSNETNINDENPIAITNSSNDSIPPITVSTLLYTSPLPSLSSSSSSTSPASSISNSSTTSTSSAYTTLDSGSDSLDSFEASGGDITSLGLPQKDVKTRCPIAVFGDNDITLTKGNIGEMLPHDDTLTQSSVWRAPKMPWQNLCTIFQAPTSATTTVSTTTIVPAPSSREAKNSSENQSDEHASLIEFEKDDDQHPMVDKLRKNLVLTQNQGQSSWFKLGTDSGGGISASTTVATLNSAMTNVAMASLEPARSIFDAARQFLSNQTTATKNTETKTTVEKSNNVEHERNNSNDVAELLPTELGEANEKRQGIEPIETIVMPSSVVTEEQGNLVGQQFELVNQLEQQQNQQSDSFDKSKVSANDSAALTVISGRSESPTSNDTCNSQTLGQTI